MIHNQTDTTTQSRSDASQLALLHPKSMSAYVLSLVSLTHVLRVSVTAGPFLELNLVPGSSTTVQLGSRHFVEVHVTQATALSGRDLITDGITNYGFSLDLTGSLGTVTDYVHGPGFFPDTLAPPALRSLPHVLAESEEPTTRATSNSLLLGTVEITISDAASSGSRGALTVSDMFVGTNFRFGSGMPGDVDAFASNPTMHFMVDDDNTIVAGDFNHDGKLNAVDIDLPAFEIRSGSNSDPIYDVDQNGEVNIDDHDFWVTNLAGTNRGDANLDLAVSFADFLALSAGFGQEGGWSQGDFDASGDVAFNDFLLLSANFKTIGIDSAAVTTSVPEPGGGGVLLALLYLAVLRPVVFSRVTPQTIQLNTLAQMGMRP